MAEVPVIQILDKKNYFKQALVPLPDALPLPPLKESSIQIRTESFSITANNFSYCAVGHFFGWWDVHPLPPSTPAPYNDATVYGRINCWGYAKVLDSTLDAVPKGSYVFGYLPIGTLPQNLQVKTGNVPGQIIVADEFRQKQLPVYNRYVVHPASVAKEIEARSEAIAYDSLVRVMHLTSYLMTKYMFPADPKQSVSLTPELADLAGATVIAFAPGSKVGLAFAHLLRNDRSGAAKPYKIVGAASEYSQAYVEGTGVYDEVALTSEDPLAFLERIGTPKDSKVAVFEFGGRAGAAGKWAFTIKTKYPNTQFTAIGGEVSDPTKSAGLPAPPEGLGFSQVMADDLLTLAMKKDGEEGYWVGFEEAWARYRGLGVKGFRVSWGEGMGDAKEGWDKFTRNEVKADEGLMFKV